MIPKNTAGFVPIAMEGPRWRYDAVIIDDDSLIQSVWLMKSHELQKKFCGFKSFEDFLKMESSICRSSPIYIDVNLGNGVSGIDIAKTIYKMGFQKIFLATGYQASELNPPEWISGIIGKEPIF